MNASFDAIYRQPSQFSKLAIIEIINLYQSLCKDRLIAFERREELKFSNLFRFLSK